MYVWMNGCMHTTIYLFYEYSAHYYLDHVWMNICPMKINILPERFEGFTDGLQHDVLLDLVYLVTSVAHHLGHCDLADLCQLV